MYVANVLMTVINNPGGTLARISIWGLLFDLGMRATEMHAERSPHR
jgi:hypothetical protein